MKKTKFFFPPLMAMVRLSSLLVVMMVMCPALLGSGAGTAQAQKVYLWVGNNSESADGGTKREISNGVPESITLGAGEYMYCIYRNTDPESYHSASVERSSSSNIGLYSVNGSGYARTIDADVAGEYTFTVTWDSNYSNLKVSVTYPEQSSGSGDSGSGESDFTLHDGSTYVSTDSKYTVICSFTPQITGTYRFHSEGAEDMDVASFTQNGASVDGNGGNDDFEGDNFDWSYPLTAGKTYLLAINPYSWNDYWNCNVFVNLVSADLTISAAQYATYYNSKYAYTMPSDCKGYIWDKTQNKLVETYVAGSVVPADEPLVIYSETAGTKTLTSTTTSNAKSANNALLGTDEATTLTADNDYYFYGLSLNSSSELSSVGFYWMNNTGAAFTNGAHKAYLKLPKTSGAPAHFLFEDEVTAVENIESADASAAATVKFFDNNQLYIRKNGRVYNAMGQLVK